MPGIRYSSLQERLLANSHVDYTTPLTNGSHCWCWLGKRAGKHGYGGINLRIDGKHVTRMAHVVSYEVFIGPAPPGLELDHLCNIPHCIHPNHLEPVTKSVNNLRKYARMREAA